jgi:hypothetical protein
MVQFIIDNQFKSVPGMTPMQIVVGNINKQHHDCR